jgi:hypothetical protein
MTQQGVFQSSRSAVGGRHEVLELGNHHLGRVKVLNRVVAFLPPKLTLFGFRAELGQGLGLAAWLAHINASPCDADSEPI